MYKIVHLLVWLSSLKSNSPQMHANERKFIVFICLMVDQAKWIYRAIQMIMECVSRVDLKIISHMHQQFLQLCIYDRIV